MEHHIRTRAPTKHHTMPAGRRMKTQGSSVTCDHRASLFNRPTPNPEQHPGKGTSRANRETGYVACKRAERKSLMRAIITTLPLPSSPSVITRHSLFDWSKSIFETSDDHRQWWHQPHPVFAGKTPWRVARHPQGAASVRDVLVSIMHGGAV